MTQPPTLSPSVAAEQELARIVEEWTARLQAGEPLDAEAFVGEHPEHASELRRLLPALGLLANLSRSGPGAVEGLAGVEEEDPGQRALGDYRIVREVGRGGMGVVYEAEQMSLRRRVALKVLPFAATMDPRHLQRFRNEAQAAACLHHPHIVPVHGVGCDRGVHFYAMQLIDGATLAELIARQRQAEAPAEEAALPAGDADRTGAYAPTVPLAAATTEGAPLDAAYYRRVAEWGVQAAEALEHAHERGIVHRDVKPGNLMIDGRGELWVTDFGLAQTADSGLTMSGDLLGTLRYMSPEQALARHGLVDHRTDVYSLGATLYELLTLRPAVEGRDRQELLRKIAFEDPKAPRLLNRRVPADLETVVLKALAKNPRERYATAKELADDLSRWLEDRPIRARRPGVVQRVKKIARRHRGVVLAVTIGLLTTIVVGGSSMAWGLVRALAAEKEQRAEAERAREAEADTKAFSDFLVDHILSATRPEGVQNGLGVDVTVARALEVAEGQIDKAFAGRPLAEARARKAIGVTWRTLGRHGPAEAQLRRALALRKEHQGADHTDTLDTQNSLAVLLTHAGKAQEAVVLHQEVLKLRKSSQGEDHPGTLNSMNNLT